MIKVAQKIIQGQEILEQKCIGLKQNSGNVQHKERIMIDLNLFEESALPESDQWWIEDLHLLEPDKALIISGAWANSSVINASQCILSKQFDLWSFCFQDVLYGLTTYELLTRW